MRAEAVGNADHAVLLPGRAAEQRHLVVDAEERLDGVLAADRLGVGLDRGGGERRARECRRRGGGDDESPVLHWFFPSYRSAGARTTISSVSSGRSRAIQRPSLNG